MVRVKLVTIATLKHLHCGGISTGTNHSGDDAGDWIVIFNGGDLRTDRAGTSPIVSEGTASRGPGAAEQGNPGIDVGFDTGNDVGGGGTRDGHATMVELYKLTHASYCSTITNT